MIRTIIIDDEKSSRETLSAFLKMYCPEIDLIAEADSAEQGIELLNKHAPDLLFLDVELPLGSGFDLLEAIDHTDFDVIFTTAHDQYALQAIKVCALDYLLKPINLAELKSAISKITMDNRKTSGSQLSTFVENVGNINKQLSKIVLPTIDGFEVVHVNNIVRCQADKNYTIFVLENKTKVMVSKTLKEYEEMLTDFDFIRVHQSHLVNASHVQRYIKGTGGYVKMSDDSIIEVSRRKKELLMQRFQL